MTIPTQTSLLTTSSAGQQPWAWLCCIWNANCGSVNPTDYHWVQGKVKSSPNASSLLVLMSVWMVIAPLCQSINYLSIGHNLRLSATLLNSSGLLNSTAISSLIGNFELLLFANLPQNLNILMLLHPTGQPQRRMISAMSRRPFSLTPVWSGSTIIASLSSGPSSPPMGLAMLSANLVTKKPWPRQWMLTDAVLTSASWQNHLRRSSIWLLLVLGSAVLMKFVSTPTLVRVLLATGWSTSATICSLGSNLYGQLAATQSNSSFLMMLPIQLFSAFECGWCAGMLISSIKTIIILLMQIIGPALELTFALTRSSKNSLSSPGLVTPSAYQPSHATGEHAILPWSTYYSNSIIYWSFQWHPLPRNHLNTASQ